MAKYQLKLQQKSQNASQGFFQPLSAGTVIYCVIDVHRLFPRTVGTQSYNTRANAAHGILSHVM